MKASSHRDKGNTKSVSSSSLSWPQFVVLSAGPSTCLYSEAFGSFSERAGQASFFGCEGFGDFYQFHNYLTRTHRISAHITSAPQNATQKAFLCSAGTLKIMWKSHA